MQLAPAGRDWEAVFTTWSQGPGVTEQEKCENAERAVRKAIAASDALARRNVDVFAQGSYANRTNVRQDSDVDVCVRLNEPFFSDLPSGVTKKDVGLVDSDYTYAQFKNDVEGALRSYFGSAAVTRGKKAFDVHANTYRVDADVVPTLVHRRYVRSDDGTFYYHVGTELRPDNGGSIINWPKQNYDNGVVKNNDTQRRFKRVVRILKRLRNEMADARIAAAVAAPSFLIECLVWNVPNDYLTQNTYRSTVRSALAHLFNSTLDDNSCNEWGEVNELKYLFRGGQPWTRQSAHDFVSAAWEYVGLK